MILLIDGNPIFDHLMKVMGVQDSIYVNVYNLVLDSHYQPSTSERDAIHVFIKFFYSRLQHTQRVRNHFSRHAISHSDKGCQPVS